MTTIYTPANADVDNASSTAKFKVGTVAYGPNDTEYVYVQADASGLTAGYVAVIDETFTADAIDTTNSATSYGQRCGVAVATFAASEYGWLQVKGVASIQTAASCAANKAINSTATAGQLDDDATAGAEVINGIVLTTAQGGSAGTAAGLLSYPTVGATL